MLEYCKLILEKVSFNENLFVKELRKSLKYVLPEERDELMAWIHKTFGERYKNLVRRRNSSTK